MVVGTKTRRQAALALTMPVAGSNRADPLRAAGTECCLLLDDRLNGRSNPLPHQVLERPFSPHRTPAIAFDSVILRHPPPSGCELGSTRRIMTLLSFSTN